MRIPLAEPDIGPLERQYVSDALASGWVSGTGPYVDAFESALGERSGRAHVIAVSSGTTALELALLALGIRPGDEVLVPALTFAAPAAAVRTVGAQPVFADITEETWTIDPLAAAALITPRTRAIIAVDVMGHPCDFQALSEFGVPIIEDAAQAHGAAYHGRPAGSNGICSIFSFHANKAITTGEGGCVATDDADVAQRARIIANHGMRPGRPYWHDHVGRNGRLTNLAAALGLAQMTRWEELLGARRRIGGLYREQLAAIGCAARPAAPWAEVSLWLQTVLLGRRDQVVSLLRGSGIDARAIWPALTDLPLYATSVRRPCPVATHVAATAAWLPTSTRMPPSLVTEVVQALGAALSSTRGARR